MKPFRAPRQVIKETQEAEMENIGRDIVGHGERWTIVARHERSESLDGLLVSHELSQVPSPSLSDFEEFLGKIETQVRTYPKDMSRASAGELGVTQAKNHRSATDEYWESVLAKEKERCEMDLRKESVPVEAMMVGASSDDDDVPIVNTLSRKQTNLGVLATLAADLTSPAKLQPKKVKQTRWTYETVCEATGVSSKYWDADAPSVRQTKLLARERMKALNDGNVDGEGMVLLIKSKGLYCISFCACPVHRSNR